MNSQPTSPADFKEDFETVIDNAIDEAIEDVIENESPPRTFMTSNRLGFNEFLQKFLVELHRDSGLFLQSFGYFQESIQ